MSDTIHNPDRFMNDLRQILSQGRKRIGLLVGAGAPMSVLVNAEGKLDPSGSPLIPDVAGITKTVLDQIEKADRDCIDTLLPELDMNPNIETILTRVRRLAQAIGTAKIFWSRWTPISKACRANLREDWSDCGSPNA